ncbi:MAG: TolC family protein [Archangium sp.]|nr:TolC family protein [Archangium sp.]
MVSMLCLVLAAERFDVSRFENAAALAPVVWARSPELHDARARVAEAVAQSDRALLLPNPGLDLSVNTLPVGPLNPTTLEQPFLNVPNVAVGVSMLLEVGKRGPRQSAAKDAARAASLDALEQLRQRTLALEDTIGDIAAAEVRVATLTELAGDAERLAALQRARAEAGDASALDADRARLEQQSVLTELGEAREMLSVGLRACGAAVAMPCVPFGDPERAAAWLHRERESDASEVAQRPDVRSLEAVEASARGAQVLAERSAVPDPTVRVGYVHDRFVISGNQQNSLFVGVGFPLPVFDRGQPEAQAAAVSAASASRARTAVVASAAAQLERLAIERGSVEARLTELRDTTVPLARSVVERLDIAVRRGATPLPELLLARRTYAELVLAANDLDRARFHLRVERSRLSGTDFPKELNDVH